MYLAMYQLSHVWVLQFLLPQSILSEQAFDLKEIKTEINAP